MLMVLFWMLSPCVHGAYALRALSMLIRSSFLDMMCAWQGQYLLRNNKFFRLQLRPRYTCIWKYSTDSTGYRNKSLRVAPLRPIFLVQSNRAPPIRRRTENGAFLRVGTWVVPGIVGCPLLVEVATFFCKSGLCCALAVGSRP
jgi:hypothetical protein